MLIRGKYLLSDPALDEGNLLEDAAVYVRRDTVEEIGSFAELSAKYPLEDVIGDGSQLLMPGFIDGHSHGWGVTPFQCGSPYTFLEKWQLDLSLNVNIDPYLSSAYSAIKHIESGCTTMHHYHSSKNPAQLEEEIEASIRAYEDVGIRLGFSLGIKNQNRISYDDAALLDSLPEGENKERFRRMMGFDAPQVQKDAFALFDKLHQAHDSAQTKVFFGPMAPQWVTDETMQAIAEKAEAYGHIPVHYHALQTPLQRAYGPRKHGKSLVAHMADLGVLRDNVSLGHAIWLNDADMELLAANGVSLTHHVSCNFNMRNGLMPLVPLRRAGVNVGIGLDDKQMNDDEDYIMEMRLIYKLHRIHDYHFQAPALSALDVIRMGTVNNSRQVGFGESIGRILPGCRADMILINMEKMLDPWTDPRNSILEVLINRGKGSDVDTVIIGGKLVMQERKILTVDKAELAARIREDAARGVSEGQKEYNRFVEWFRPYYYQLYEDWLRQETDPYYVLNSK